MPASPARTQAPRAFELEEEIINFSTSATGSGNRHKFSFFKETQTILRRPFTFNSLFKLLGLFVVGGGAAVSFFGAAAIAGFPLNVAGAALGLVSATVWLLAVGRALYNKFAAAGSFLDESLKVKVIFILPKMRFVKTPLSIVGDMIADTNKLSSQITHNMQEAKSKFEQLKDSIEKLREANPAAAEVFIKLYLKSEEQQHAFYKELYEKIETLKKAGSSDEYGKITPELANLANKHFKDTNFNIINYYKSVSSFCDVIRATYPSIEKDLSDLYQGAERRQQLIDMNKQFRTFFREAANGKYGRFTGRFKTSMANLKLSLMNNRQSILPVNGGSSALVMAAYPFGVHFKIIKNLVGQLDRTLQNVINKLASIEPYDAINDERKKQFSRQQKDYSKDLTDNSTALNEGKKSYEEFTKELASSIAPAGVRQHSIRKSIAINTINLEKPSVAKAVQKLEPMQEQEAASSIENKENSLTGIQWPNLAKQSFFKANNCILLDMGEATDDDSDDETYFEAMESTAELENKPICSGLQS